MHVLLTHSSLPSTFLACGAVTTMPLSNLNKFISNPLQIHHVLTVLIAFFISLPFNSHFASSFISFLLNFATAAFSVPSEGGRRERNFCQRRRRDVKGRDLKRRWMLTRDRKAASIVE